MSIGNIVGSFVRNTAASISQFACEAASTANQMAGEAFTNPGKFIEEVKAGATYALANKASEFVASSSIIIGGGR